MSLKDYINTMRPAVEEALQAFVRQAIPSDSPEINQMVEYHMGWVGEGAGPEAQGKRVRPLLVLLCAEAAGGDWRNALPAATAVELLHNFSLVHDDIQDQSPLRRNRPTVWTKWGTAQAINTGDVLFTLSFQALHDLEATLPAASVLDAVKLMHKTCLSLTEGQYLDMSYETKNELPLDDYWKMIGGKTSSLLSCCSQLGAISAGACIEQQENFARFGYNLGLAFQVLDDWLGIWGDTSVTGKSAVSDLTAGKKTLPVLYGLGKEGPFARRWLLGPLTADEAQAAAGMLRDVGAYDYTLDTAQKLTEEALDALYKAVLPSKAGQALEELTRQLLSRKK
jgi:geranylgeranyl diphosphate synthase, type I